MPRAKAANPRKNRNFTIEIDGLEQYYAQKVTIPEVEVEIAEHADANHPIKTGTALKFEDVVIEKLMFAEGGDTFAWDWITEVQNPETGGGGLPSAYKKDIVIKQYAPDGVTLLDTWNINGTFPRKVSYSELDRMSTENSAETITLCVDYYIRSA